MRAKITKRGTGSDTQPPLNQYIESYLTSKPALRDLVFKKTCPHLHSHPYNGDSPGVVLFEKTDLQRLIQVHSLKSSYYDVKAVPFLFDIAFPSKGTGSPKLHLYRYEEEKLKLISITNMVLKEKTDLLKIYTCFEGTPLKLTLSIFKSELQTAFCLKEKFNKTLVSLTSAESLNRPIKQVRAYLELIHDCPIFKDLEEEAEVKAKELLEKIASSKKYRKTLIEDFSADPNALQLFFGFRPLLYKKDSSFPAKKMIEDVILKGLGYRVEECIKIDETALAFALKRNQSNVLILYKKLSSKGINTLKTLTDTLQKFHELQKKFPETTHQHIEFIVEAPLGNDEETLRYLKKLSIPETLKLSSLTFSFEQRKQPKYYIFGFDTEKGFSPPISFHGVHPLLYEYYELFRYNHFDLTQDLESATLPNHLFLAHRSTPNKLIENRIIGYSMVSACAQDTPLKPIAFQNIPFEKNFKAMITDMEKSLGGNPMNRKAFFNRLVFQTINQISSTDDEIIASITKVLKKHQSKLRKLRVEKVIFKYVGKHQENLIEIKNLLDGEIHSRVFAVDRRDRKTQILPAKKVEARELNIVSRGGVWAYRIPSMIHTLAEDMRKKLFNEGSQPIEESYTELDLDHSLTVIHPSTGFVDYNIGELMPVSRPLGQNEAGVVIGVIVSDLGIGFPVRRVLIIGDLSHPSRGAIRGQECIRINAAIRYAEREKIPIDWYAASYGVQIHRERGVEGLDAAASTLREIVENCHHKGVQINLIIDEANIGAQSYWDSMAAIVYETSGILIMTPKGSMALTGPKALACALYGRLHSEQIDKYTKALYPKGLQSLSGHELVHGPNSDSMVLAKDLEEASRFLILHHYYAYLKPNEKIVSERRIFVHAPGETKNTAINREIDNFLKGLKPDRNMILNHLIDKDSPPPLQFWSSAKGICNQNPQGGDLPQEATSIVQECLIGGHSTLVIFTPTGPLTPADADIIARAIYKASGRQQVLIIGSLSGFSCDPLSMQNRQLLEGALIAKAIIEHVGPILILNLGSLVGGTFVVFNKQLHPDLRILAVEGARVQVIGGKSASKVVFHSLICRQAERDDRVLKLAKAYHDTSRYLKRDYAIQRLSSEKMSEIETAFKSTRSQVIAEIEDNESEQFDQFHNAQRAMKVKSIDQIISSETLRESLIKNFQELRTAYINKTLRRKDGFGKHYKSVA